MIALAVTDEEIRGQGLHFLGNFIEIQAFPDHGGLRQEVVAHFSYGFMKVPTLPARSAEDRADANFQEKGGKAHHQVFFAIHHGLFVKDVLVAVHVGVDEAAPLPLVQGRCGLPG